MSLHVSCKGKASVSIKEAVDIYWTKLEALEADDKMSDDDSIAAIKTATVELCEAVSEATIARVTRMLQQMRQT